MASIRPVEESDSHALAHVRPGYGRDDVEERLRWLREEGEGEWLVIVEEGEILGWGVLVLSGKKSSPECPDVMDLYVRKAHRKRGLGSCLLLHMEDRVRRSGRTKLGLAVNPDLNPDAHRLYKRIGYRHDGGPTYLDGVYDGTEDWVIDLEKDLG